jgi:electron transfer flavoprotein alpha subunit
MVMTLATLWVVVEPSNGSLTSTSLELLTHARALATNVAAITWGDDGASFAAVAGEYGATTLYNVGALSGALPERRSPQPWRHSSRAPAHPTRF